MSFLAAKVALCCRCLLWVLLIKVYSVLLLSGNNVTDWNRKARKKRCHCPRTISRLLLLVFHAFSLCFSFRGRKTRNRHVSIVRESTHYAGRLKRRYEEFTLYNGETPWTRHWGRISFRRNLFGNRRVPSRGWPGLFL